MCGASSYSPRRVRRSQSAIVHASHGGASSLRSYHVVFLQAARWHGTTAAVTAATGQRDRWLEPRPSGWTGGSAGPRRGAVLMASRPARGPCPPGSRATASRAPEHQEVPFSPFGPRARRRVDVVVGSPSAGERATCGVLRDTLHYLSWQCRGTAWRSVASFGDRSFHRG